MEWCYRPSLQFPSVEEQARQASSTCPIESKRGKCWTANGSRRPKRTPIRKRLRVLVRGPGKFYAHPACGIGVSLFGMLTCFYDCYCLYFALSE